MFFSGRSFQAGRLSLLFWATLLLQACGPQRRPLEAPKELRRDTYFHALPQTQLGIYAVFLPPGYYAAENRDKKYPLVLILHGHGSTEIRHGQHADEFGREDVIYLAPRAPYPHEGVFMEHKTPGWTAMPPVPSQLHDIGPDHKDYIDVDRLYTNWIADTIQDVRRRYRVNEQRVVLYGHSQGATYAHLFALHHPELVKAYFAFAGWYGEPNESFKPEDAQTLLKNSVFPFLAHNRHDPMLEVAQTERLSSYLTKQNVPHTTFLSETGDHYLTDEEKKKVAAFVDEWCRGTHASLEPKLPPLPLPQLATPEGPTGATPPDATAPSEPPLP
jgi:predicted esterase